jgi:hypothetical protein
MASLFAASASDFEIRESRGMRRALVRDSPAKGARTPRQARLARERPDNQPARYHHPTPKEGRLSPQPDTANLIAWQASEKSPPRPQYSPQQHGKRHIPAPWSKSCIRNVITSSDGAAAQQAMNVRGPRQGCNRGSNQVQLLLQHQVAQPSTIEQKMVSGKRGAGSSLSKQAALSASRDAKLSAAEDRRILRPAGVPTSEKKKKFYASDPANFFGFQSALGRNPNPIGRAPKRSELENNNASTPMPWSPSTRAAGRASFPNAGV